MSDIHRSGSCLANGCPMSGTIKSGTDWLCRFHWSTPSSAWQETTRRLRQRAPLIETINDLVCGPVAIGPKDTHPEYERFRKDPKENLLEYRDQLERELKRFVSGKEQVET